ncbi:MAG: SRPBCC domain-containing protein [Aureispira sp.]|nr:SRPBCC domain-containing protein [Aureispira sp.]
MHTPNNKKLHKTTIANCTLDTAWWKWTSHEGLKTFFGADNSIRLRLGGPFEIYFMLDAPLGQRGGEGNKVISYLPKKMLSFTWNAPPHIQEVRNHEHKTWVVVELEEVDNTQTKVSLSHIGWLDGAAWEETFDYFDSAWERVLEWFSNSCEKNAE